MEFECNVLVLVEAEKKVGAIALEDQLTYEGLPVAAYIERKIRC